MWSKPVYTNRKSASAERCLRALGATLAMGIPVMRRSKHSRQGVFSHQGLRKASAADPVNTGLAGSAGMAGLLSISTWASKVSYSRSQAPFSAKSPLGRGKNACKDWLSPHVAPYDSYSILRPNWAIGVFLVSEKALSHEEQWYIVRCSPSLIV